MQHFHPVFGPKKKQHWKEQQTTVSLFMPNLVIYLFEHIQILRFSLKTY
jgi:hypothetical protein